MGASLAYLDEPIRDVEQEEGENDYIKYATASCQGWRLNMEDSHITNTKF